MIYTPNTKRALALCFAAHKEQVDKAGAPYVFHPFHVAEQMPDEDTTVVALLHDVVEDSAYTLDDVRAAGFSEAVCEALALLTHAPDVPYLDYVAALRDNRIAAVVKRADLQHNCDLTRLNAVDEAALQRIRKYQAALALLEE